MRFLRRLFADPSIVEGAAPAPLPAPGSLAWQVEQGHQLAAAARRGFGRFTIAHPSAPSPIETAETAEHAAMHLLLFAQQVRDGALDPVTVPDSPEGLS